VPIRLERKRLACCVDEVEALHARCLRPSPGLNCMSRLRTAYVCLCFRSPAAKDGRPSFRLLKLWRSCSPYCYLIITPQAIRSPELPDGSVFISSAAA
jgi:hypothetical protein